MISFNLSCDNGHGFEGWFGSSADYENQQERGLVTCPICNSSTVSKALMAPNVTAKSNQRHTQPTPVSEPSDQVAISTPAAPNIPQAPVQQMAQQMAQQVAAQMTPQLQEAMGEAIAEMRKFQKTVETQCDDVGEGFAEEARKIHYGEAKPRGIYGRTTDEEAEALVDEGIEITKMPWLPKEQ